MKRIGVFLLSLMLAFTFVSPTKVSAAGEVSVTTPEQLTQAVQNATALQPVTIVLQDDIDFASSNSYGLVIDGGKDITIDLNGHNISKDIAVFKLESATLSFVGTGKVCETDPYFGPVVLKGTDDVATKGYTTLNVGSNVTLEGYAGVFVDNNAGKNEGIVVNVNGTLKGVVDSTGAQGMGIYINGVVKPTNNVPQININPTAKVSGAGPAIYAAGNGNWVVEDGAQITGVSSAIAIKSGTMTINGGTIKATGEDTSPTTGWSNGVNASGSAIQIESNKGYYGNIILDITGGKFESANASVIYDYLDKTSGKETTETNISSISISGGEFTSGTGKNVLKLSQESSSKFEGTISGGVFSTDPTLYLATDYEVKTISSKYAVVKTQVVVAQPPVNDTPSNVVVGVVSDEATEEMLLNSALEIDEYADLIIEAAINGETVAVEVEVGNLDVSQVTPQVKAQIDAIKEEASDIEFAQFFDISVLLKIANQTVGEIGELKSKITIKMAIPVELIEEGREFVVYRVHNGVVEALETTTEDGFIYFETDSFSTYALGYVGDTTDNDNTGTNNPINTGNTGSTGNKVNTGDNNSLTNYIAIGGGALLITVVAYNKKRKLNKQ